MIFLKNVKNRIFKQKSNWRGQIFPVLLICLAGLLVAVAITKKIGDANVAKTSASNAADAGSLSAASCWAGAFNRLVYRNWDKNSDEALLGTIGHQGKYMGYSVGAFNNYYYYKEMNFYYVEMRKKYELLKLKAGEHLDNAAKYLQQAIDKANEALPLIAAVKMECSNTWNNQDAVDTINKAAGALVIKAAYYVGAFNACAAYMGNGQDDGLDGTLKNGVASWFKKNQLQNISDAFAFMDETYTRAIQTGQYYAMSNSGYTSSLSSKQADEYGFWLGGGTGGSGFFPGTGGGTLSFTPKDGGCSITATVVLPKVSNYEILMSDWNFPKAHTLVPIPITCADFIPSTAYVPRDLAQDPFNYQGSKKLVYDLLAISDYLALTLASKTKAFHDASVTAANCCPCGCNNSGPECSGGSCDDGFEPDGITPKYKKERHVCDPVAAYRDAESMRTNLRNAENCIINVLTDIKNAAPQNLSVNTLKTWNNDIFKYVWPEFGVAANVTKTVVTAQEVKDYIGVADPIYKGMMVINIRNVTLSDGEWKVSCLSTASCGSSSFSKSKFYGQPSGKGELVGDKSAPPFNPIYFPEITDIN